MSAALVSSRLQSPLSDGVSSGAVGRPNIGALQGLLGPVQLAPQYDVRSSLPRTDVSIEEAYKDKIEYLGRSISAFVLSTPNDFMLTKIFPVRVTDNLYASFSTTTPDRGFIPQASEKSAPHLVTSTTSEQMVTLKRYRIGIKASIEGLKTATGQFTLALHAVTAAMNIRETMEIVALDMMFREKQHYAELARRQGVRHPNPAAALAADVEYFDALHKFERGIYHVLEAAKNTMNKYGIIPDHLILDEGMRSLIQMTDAQLDYYRSGPGNRERIERGADALPTVAGLTVSIAKASYASRGGRTVAPMRRPVVLADWFPLTDTTADCGPERYMSCQRRVYVLDGSMAPNGDWRGVDVLDAAEASGRYNWRARGRPLSSHVYDLAERVVDEARERGLTLEDGYADPDLFRREDTTYGVAELYGQKEEAALPDEVVASTAASVAHVVRKHLNAGDEEALRAAQRAIDRLYQRSATADDVAFARVIAAGAVDAAGIAGAANRYGGPSLPAAGAAGLPAGLANYEPFGFGSWAGLLSIADEVQSGAPPAYLSASLAAVAVAGAAALESVFEAVAPLFPGHPMFAESAVPAYARGSDARARALVAFAQNFVDRAKLPLYVQPADDAPAARAIVDVEALAAPVAPNELEFARTIQRIVRAYPRPELVAEFANEASFNAFRTAYERSAFARAFAAANPDVAPESRFIDLLTSDNVYSLINAAAANDGADTASMARVVALLGHVVRVVRGTEELPRGRPINATLDAWSRDVAERPSNAALASAPNAGLDAGAAPRRLTRLVAPFDKLGATNNALLMASPLDITRVYSSTSSAEFDAYIADSRTAVRAVTLFATQPGGGASVRAPRDVFDDADLTSGGGASAAAGASFEVNRALRERYARIGAQERDPLVRAAAQLVVLARNSGDQLVAWYKNSVRVPDDFIGYRLNRRYQTKSIVVLKTTGNDFGFMAFREIDVQRGHDPISREHIINVTPMFAPVIMHPEYYLVVRDVQVCRYFGGESLEAFTPETFVAAEPDEYKSVVYAKCGAGSLRGTRAPSAVHDVRGRFDADVLARCDPAGAAADARRPHTDGALFLAYTYKLDEMVTLQGADHDAFYPPFPHLQPVAFRTAHKVWSNETSDHTKIIKNTDPFGENVGPGDWVTRNSDLTVYRKPQTSV